MKLKRNAGIAALSNMLMPGLGYLYVGRLRYAVVLPLLLILILSVSAWSGFIFIPWGVALTYLFILCIVIAGVVSAVIIARRSEGVELKKYQRWYLYLGFIIVSMIANDLLRSQRATLLGYDAHRIPSSSMSPTLLPGDFIISNTWSYKNQAPVRGDVVVFSGPGDVLYVKRIIGMPGDLIEMRNEQLMINHERVQEDYVKDHNNRRSKEQTINFHVPEGRYYLLGDNRDNSSDGRHWGAIASEEIMAKVSRIWFSFHPEEGLIRERIGKSVNRD